MQNHKPAILLFILLILSFSCGRDNESGNNNAGQATESSESYKSSAYKAKAIISADSGLYVRDIPSTNGKKEGLLPKATVVDIVAKGPEETIKDGFDVTANWYKVKAKGLEGWVFGGYLYELKDINPSGISWSNGSGCDPVSYSEYHQAIELKPDGTIEQDYSGAFGLGGDCPQVENVLKSGTYTRNQDNSFRVTYQNEKTETTADPQNGANCPVTESTSKTINETVTLYPSECVDNGTLSGKKAKRRMLYDPVNDILWVEETKKP